MDLKKYLSILLILILSVSAYGQVESKGIPYIKNYSKADYDGNAQNWSIIQDNRGIMYFANHTYILEYDGKTWNKITIPGDPIIYTLSKDKSGRIFVGAVGEFGYLEASPSGCMKYKSLIDKIPEEKKEFTQVVYMTNGTNDEMLFLTPLVLYIYDNDTIQTIDTQKPENIFVKAYEVNNKLYIQEKGAGIHEYKDGKLSFIEGSEIYANKYATGMFSDTKNSMYITTYRDSVFRYSQGEFNSSEKSPLFQNLYSLNKFIDNYYIGGLLGNGMILFNKNLKVLKHITTENGLQNNTIYNVFADNDDNIWLATNDGISIIFPNLPFSVFSDNSNLTEAVHTSKLYKNKLYIGSTTGIFYKDFSKKNSVKEEKFQLLESTQGNVNMWKIDVVNNTLLCASQRGLLEIIDNKANLIGPGASVKNFIQLKENSNIILTTSGYGLMLFEFTNGKWVYKHTLKNFKGNYKHIEEDSDGSFWISDRTKGVFHLKINQEMDSVIEETLYTGENGLPSTQNNYVFKINSKLVFATEKGVYSYDKNLKKFIKDSEFEKIFDEDISITNLYQAENGNIWFKQEIDDPKKKYKKYWELGLIKKVDGNYKIIKTPFYKVKNRINSINQISNNELVVGTETGFVLYNLDTKKQFDKPFNALIRKVEFIKNDSLLFGGAFFDKNNNIVPGQDPKRIPEIPYEYNDLRFYFSSVFFEEPEKTQYMFKLQGNDKEWSDWKSITSKEYSNLDHGTYTFIVKAKNLYNIESEVAEYTFEILPPWYRTLWAYVGYFILFVLFIYGVIQLSIFRLKKQRENLKRIVEERTKEIQIQKEEIEAKNETLSEQNEEIIQKNNSITASINYAKRIQEAMLPLKEKITAGLEENFILFKPRDIVSGDFYWYAEKNNKIIYTAVDCTGHGVPGALMSMIGSEILTTIVNKNITKADEILEKMNESVIKVLKQDTEGFSQDGMDMALCVIDKENKTIEFAGAKNPLIYITNGKLIQVKANRSGIGGYQQEKKDFSSHIIQYESPTWFYMFTDGFQDQFGGPNDRKYMIKRLKELLLDIHYKPMQEQHDILKKEIEDWMIDSHQTDDILLACIKL